MSEPVKEKIPAQKYLGMFVEEDVRTFRILDSFAETLQKVLEFARSNSIDVTGHRTAIYIADPGDLGFRLFVGYPVGDDVVVVDHDHAVLSLEASDGIVTSHKGDHDTLPEVHRRMHEAVSDEGVLMNKYIIEEYTKDVTVEPEPSKWETRVIYYVLSDDKKAREGQNKKRSILILEDEVMLSKALSGFLVKFGFEVVVAGDGNEAAELAEARSFDLALLDLLVPGHSGFEILKMLRKKDKDIPIFILSNLEEQENKKKAAELGVNKYFVKSETLLSEVAKEISKYLKENA